MSIESFTFDKGINLKKSPLFLEDGEVYSIQNFSFNHIGILEGREAKTVGVLIDVDE